MPCVGEKGNQKIGRARIERTVRKREDSALPTRLARESICPTPFPFPSTSHGGCNKYNSMISGLVLTEATV